jgi:hypothetical protein
MPGKGVTTSRFRARIAFTDPSSDPHRCARSASLASSNHEFGHGRRVATGPARPSHGAANVSRARRGRRTSHRSPGSYGRSCRHGAVPDQRRGDMAARPDPIGRLEAARPSSIAVGSAYEPTPRAFGPRGSGQARTLDWGSAAGRNRLGDDERGPRVACPNRATTSIPNVMTLGDIERLFPVVAERREVHGPPSTDVDGG